MGALPESADRRMAYFEVQLTRKLQRVYDIAPDSYIGRAPQCQIQLLSRAVSRRHARLEIGDQGEAIVSDLGTKNGVKLNGKRIQGAAVVAEGDVIVVGDVSMVFRAADRHAPIADAVDLRNRAPGPEDLRAAFQPRSAFMLRAEPNAQATFQHVIARNRIERLEFDEMTRFKLQIALKEALDNARIHGSRNDRNRSILITFAEDDDEFVMTVKDEGPGYEVETVLGGAQEIDALEAVRARAQLGTGLGLRMILNCVDRVQYDQRGALLSMGKFKEAGQVFVIADENDPGGGGGADPADELGDTRRLPRQGGGPDEEDLLSFEGP